MGVIAAGIDIARPTRYIHWGWFQISVPNLIVILLMIAVLVLAIALPFPGSER